MYPHTNINTWIVGCQHQLNNERVDPLLVYARQKLFLLRCSAALTISCLAICFPGHFWHGIYGVSQSSSTFRTWAIPPWVAQSTGLHVAFNLHICLPVVSRMGTVAGGSREQFRLTDKTLCGAQQIHACW